jgi:hypothetical protein
LADVLIGIPDANDSIKYIEQVVFSLVHRFCDRIREPRFCFEYAVPTDLKVCKYSGAVVKRIP